MKYLTRHQMTGLLAAGLLGVGASQSVLAAGTLSNTDISNTATVDFQVGGIDQTATSDSATFKVDNKVDVTVSTGGDVTVIPGSQDQVLTYTITNTGNTTQTYSLVLGGTTAIMENVEVYLDTNGNGTYEPLTDTTLYTSGSGASIGDIVPDGDSKVFLVSDTLASAIDGATEAYTMTATTLDAGTTTVTQEDTDGDDPTLVEVVFADAAGATDADNNGDFSATAAYDVGSAALAVNKSAAVVSDPVNGTTSPYALPGAVVAYTIDVSNTGSTDATSVEVTDPIPANTSFVVGGVTTTGTVAYSNDSGTTYTYSPVADANGVDITVTNLRVTFANVAATSGTAQVAFEVKID